MSNAAKQEKTSTDAEQQQPEKAKVLPLKRQAKPARFSLAAQIRQVHAYILPAGTNFEDVLAPEFWLPVLRNLKPWGRIEAVEETGAYWSELLILDVNERGASVQLLRFCKLAGVGSTGRLPINVSGAAILYGGIHRKWCVERGEVSLQDGFPSEEAARRWLETYSKVTMPTGAAPKGAA